MPFDAAPIAIKADCLLCPVRSCLARRGSSQLTADWGEILAPRQAVMPGTGELCRSGERLRSLYSVRGGCIKAYTLDSDGKERIRGFYLPGDIIGLDGMADGVCLSNAAAVEPSQVCVAGVVAVRQLMQRQPELAQRVMEQTSRELALALAWCGDYSAEQRLAAFLLHLYERIGSGGVLRLPMAQRDIGNYLRLATETVCRTIKSFQRKGWLSQGERSVRFINADALSEVASAVGLSNSAPKLAWAA